MRGSVGTLLRVAAQVLSRAGVPSPAVDAELLLAHALHRELADLRRARLMGEDVPEATISTYQGLISRRAERVPVQHLTGRAHFAGVDLLVGPGVFIPRPETELIIELALTALEGLESPTVVDLCTGSGALALAIAHARPDARVGAVELSPEAHRYAVANVAQTGLVIDLRLGPAQDSFGDWAGTVDVVVSNPPYIPPDAVPIDPEVRDHDPALALYGGGEDGLDLPRALGEQAAVLLRPGAVLLMEHADAQGVSLPAALAAQGHWDTIEDLPDLAGRPRVTRASQTRRARD